MTHDLDQSLELIGALVTLFFVLPFLMARLEDTLDKRERAKVPTPGPENGSHLHRRLPRRRP